jgi:hypothetical protein
MTMLFEFIPHPAIDTVANGLRLPLEVDGRPVRALVSQSALQAHFGATSEPRSWLAAYRQHAGAVNRAAIRKRRAGAAEPVLLTPADF